MIVSAGYMRVLGSPVVDRWRDRWLNVHPALLPSFPGIHAVADALAAGVKVTGVTVHLVDAGVDTGPIVLQEAIAIRPDDDWDALEVRVHEVEHRLLPRAVRALLQDRLVIHDRIVEIQGGPVSTRPIRRALLAVYDKTGHRRAGPRPSRAGRPARVERGNGGRAPRGRRRRDRGRRRHRVPRDARRTREDAAPGDPRGAARRSTRRGAPRPDRGAGDRAVRSGRVQPVPVPRDGRGRRELRGRRSRRSTSAAPRWCGRARRTSSRSRSS